MRRSHFIGADGDGLAVDLDGPDGVDQPVQLEEVLWWGLHLDAALGDQWVVNLIFVLGVVLNLLWFSVFFLLGLNEHFIRLSNKHSTELINLITIFFLYVSEFGEVKIGAAAPVKSLPRELVAPLEVQSLSDVIILFNSLDLAPEQDLIELGCLRKLH